MIPLSPGAAANGTECPVNAMNICVVALDL